MQRPQAQASLAPHSLTTAPLLSMTFFKSLEQLPPQMGETSAESTLKPLSSGSVLPSPVIEASEINSTFSGLAQAIGAPHRSHPIITPARCDTIVMSLLRQSH